MFEISISKGKCPMEKEKLLFIYGYAESGVQNIEQFQCYEISGTHVRHVQL